MTLFKRALLVAIITFVGLLMMERFLSVPQPTPNVWLFLIASVGAGLLSLYERGCKVSVALGILAVLWGAISTWQMHEMVFIAGIALLVGGSIAWDERDEQMPATNPGCQ